MGGCIVSPDRLYQFHVVFSLYGRVYRTYAAYAERAESFLPIWEGVSSLLKSSKVLNPFPPYMGGCIAGIYAGKCKGSVSSLYGRVYRLPLIIIQTLPCFLPIWEGVSADSGVAASTLRFPPYMGGCIGSQQKVQIFVQVSSLYGRVYRYL